MEVLLCFTTLGYASPLSSALCNAGALAALPDALRAAVAAGQAQARGFRAILLRQAGNKARMAANGVVQAAAPALRAALASAAGLVVAEWAAAVGGDGRAALSACHG